MEWSNLAFFHWPVPVSQLRPLVPKGLEIDCHEGTAYVGLVPFTMRDVHHRGLPRIPTATTFHECNVRTYVRGGGVPGVWFFSLDAASRLAVWGAKLRWNLNYVHAAIRSTREGAVTDYEVRRTRRPHAGMNCRWRVGEALPRSTPGSLTHFLTERYAMFAESRRGELFLGRIWHEPWSLFEAELLELDDGLVEAAGLPAPDTPPLCLHAHSVHATAWKLGRLEDRGQAGDSRIESGRE